MDQFCGDQFWNSTITWDTNDPYFTNCFEQTVLVWGPCIFLWIFTLLEIYYLRISYFKSIPWGFVNISKLLIVIVLLVVTVYDLFLAASNKNENFIYPVHIYTPIIKLITFVLVGTLTYFNKKFGQRTSGVLFLFWMLLLICSIPRCRSEVLFNNHRKQTGIQNEWTEKQFITFMIFFTCTCVQFILNCFVDKAPLESKYINMDRPNPELNASFLSRIFFAWFDQLIWIGYKKPLESDDLWSMKPEDYSKEVVLLFTKHWYMSLGRFDNEKKPADIAKIEYRKNRTSVNITTPKPLKKNASILPALCKTFGPTFIFGSCLKLTQDILTFVSPQLLRLIIDYVRDDNNDEPEWRGVLYAVSLFIVACIQSIVLAQYFNRMFSVGLGIRTVLISTIYKKALIMSNATKKNTTVGEIVNLMAVDAQRFIDLTGYINLLWSAPLQIGLALYFLWDILGPSVLAGLGVMLILIPINGMISNKLKNLQILQMKYKDERVKLMNEILNGMKVLKLYAWEKSFENEIQKIRQKEVKILRKTAYFSAGTSFIWSCAPFLVTIVTFATFVLVDESNVLNETNTFVSLALFNILRFPLSMLPMLITNMVQTGVSIKRINKFLNSEELDPENVNHDITESSPLVINNGNFSWGDTDELCLKNINVRINKGELVAIVGTVGSGKSSLISAFLGEMNKVSGNVNILGKIAYVSQQAWIQNATLRDNILFGKPYDRDLYDRVVSACALKQDFEMLPAGDETEIGEKGINLSGGQKQRVSLARAVYNDADIYLLDDPLSAVDSHVGKHIFEEVISTKGLLGSKIRVLVTHALTYLPKTDNIYVLKNGEISESGNYQNLITKHSSFSEFLIQYLQEGKSEEDELDEIKRQLENTIGSEELRSKLNRGVSTIHTHSDSSDRESFQTLSRQISESSNSTNLRGRSEKTGCNTSSSKEEIKEKDILIEKETVETGNVKWTVYKHYLKHIGIVLSLVTFFFNLIFQCFSVISNLWLVKWSSDRNVANDTQLRNMYLGIYGALGLGQGISSVFCDLAPKLGTLIAAIALHQTLINGVIRAPISFFDVTPSGRILARFSKDIDVLDSNLPHQISFLIRTIFELLAILVIISISSYQFLIIAIPIGILYYIIQRVYIATSRQLKRLESVSRSPIYSHFSESVIGIHTIRAFGVEDRFIDESEKRVDHNQISYYSSIIAHRWLSIRLELIGNIIILFVALFAVLTNHNAGLVGLSISYALQLTESIKWMVRITSDVETNIVAVERIKEYSETKQEAPWENSNYVLPRNWPESGSVSFNDYKLRYRDGLDLVLKGITFHINGGEKIGIVGRTGAGKSSLTYALFRIIEAADGNILIDGQDISKLGLHELRSRLTIIPQDPVLFSGTLRLNLDPFDSKSDAEVWMALEHAHLKSFVNSLPAGLNHHVAEGGENFSIGQRQLVCLARALLRKTKLLILDEATAAVDLETDDLIQKIIRSTFKECTVLTIAHRLNTIMDSDKVIVLDKGTIIEFESPSVLLEDNKSVFYGMAKDANLLAPK